MLYILLNKLPIDIIYYIKLNFLKTNKKCKTCHREIKFNMKNIREINNWTYCSSECYNFI